MFIGRGSPMLFVSDFADQAVMLPLSAVILVTLGLMGWWRGAVAWLVAVGSVFTTMLVLKSGLVMLSDGYGSDYMISPSGHVASACMLYGGMAVLLLGGVVPDVAVAAVPVVAAGVVGYSRIALGAHSLGEVVAGAVVGCIGVLVLSVTAGPRPRRPAWPVAAAAACTVLMMHGMHMPAEDAIRLASMGW